MANYIDADTVDKITAARRPKALAGTIKKTKPKDETQQRKEVQEEHRQRIQKMKELYGMFMKMEAEEKEGKAHGEDDVPEVAEQQQPRTVVQQAKGKARMLPEVPTSPHSMGQQQNSPFQSRGSASKDIENVRLPDIPQDQLGRSLQSQNGPAEAAPANQNFMKTSKFTSIKQPAADIGDEMIDVDIRDRGYSSLKKAHPMDTEDLPLQSNNKSSKVDKKERSAADGASLIDGDVDGLLKWAKDLPDISGPDGFAASGSSFFKKGIF